MFITIPYETEVGIGREDEKIYFTLKLRIEADVEDEPGVTSGPPENCYPGHSECIINEIHLLETLDADGNAVFVHEGAKGRMLAALDEEAIEAAVWEAYHERCNEPPDPPDQDPWED